MQVQSLDMVMVLSRDDVRRRPVLVMNLPKIDEVQHNLNLLIPKTFLLLKRILLYFGINMDPYKKGFIGPKIRNLFHVIYKTWSCMQFLLLGINRISRNSTS